MIYTYIGYNTCTRVIPRFIKTSPSGIEFYKSDITLLLCYNLPYSQLFRGYKISWRIKL